MLRSYGNFLYIKLSYINLLKALGLKSKAVEKVAWQKQSRIIVRTLLLEKIIFAA